MGGTSRVSREAQARISEGLGVQLPGPTRPRGEIPRADSAAISNDRPYRDTQRNLPTVWLTRRNMLHARTREPGTQTRRLQPRIRRHLSLWPFWPLPCS
jgi:hypothetical protein